MSRELVPAGRRALTRGHITFYRAVLDGIDLAKAWDLYLTTDGDFTPAHARATSEWVRQALVNEAIATGQPELIGLFRREPWRVKTSTKPTLSEFSDRLADAGEWSEADLMEMWKEEFGAPDKAEARRDRLSKRLREALLLLERAPRLAPSGADAVARWLAPNLVTCLAAAGLTTLQSVRDALAARTTPRWEAVPGVGEVWADRLSAWLTEQGIEPTSPAPALAAAAPQVDAILPLERFELPFTPVFPIATEVIDPSGVAPASRPCRNTLGAKDDKDAIRLWLEAKASNPNTRRAYRKNAERFLQWCYVERRIPFAALTLDDCIHYREWLTALGRKSVEDWAAAGWRLPVARWIGPRVPRTSSAWRPFEGPLTADSIAFDLLTVRALFDFLVVGEYLPANPWALMGKKVVARTMTNSVQQFKTRSLTLAQWKYVVDGLDPQGPELERRLLLVLWLGFASGLRAAEMLSLKLGSLLPEHEPWRMRVVGKGEKERIVPLPSPARDALLRYLASVDVSYEEVVSAALGPEDSAAALQPVLRGRFGRRPKAGGAHAVDALHYTQLYDTLTAHLKRCAAALEARDPIAAGKLRSASTHWLRHTCASLALKNGVRLTSVQKLLGHSDINTTAGYLTEHDDELAADMESFVGRTH